MPYILPEDREALLKSEEDPKCAGDLNFLFTSIINKYLGKNPRYQDFNDVVGALENCKLELYRRKVAPYEEKKISENGDLS